MFQCSEALLILKYILYYFIFRKTISNKMNLASAFFPLVSKRNLFYKVIICILISFTRFKKKKKGQAELESETV